MSVCPFVGGIFDRTLAADAGWEPARVVVDLSAAQLNGPLRAFGAAPLSSAAAAAANPIPPGNLVSPSLPNAMALSPLRVFPAVPPAETAPESAAALRSTVVSVAAVPPAPAPTRCCNACDQTTNPNMTKCHSQAATAKNNSCCDPTTPSQQRWHYAFDRNIVGMAAISADAYSLSCGAEPNCTGSITLQCRTARKFKLRFVIFCAFRVTY